MTLIDYVFPMLQSAKDLVRQVSKKLQSRRRFNKWHGKRSEKLMKSEGQHLYRIYWSIWMKLSWKKSLLVICKMLGLFVNTLTTNGKYFPLSGEKLKEPIHMELTMKQKKYSESFSGFSKSWVNFGHFRKNDHSHGFFMSSIADCEGRG